jgi:mRNA interferase MazF
MTRNPAFSLPSPFDDLASGKVRPAVCLTNPIGPHRHIVLAFITGSVPVFPLATDLVIDFSDAGFASTGLRAPSTLQLHRLMTASTGIILRELGCLPPNLRAEVREPLRKLFDLA